MFDGSGAMTLPRPLQRRIDGMAAAFLRTPSGRDIDFSTPEGEPAFISPDSVSWRVFKNPVTLFIGGVTAVLLELAEPRVGDGIWNHSSFRTDPLARLRRTGLAAMVTVYGPRSRAEAMIARVVKVHDQVSGRTSDGVPYQASDPELLGWVQATASFGFIQAYHVYGRSLLPSEREAQLAEGRPAALRYGAIEAPASLAELDALFAAMESKLAPSPVVFEFLAIMARVPVFPGPGSWLQPMFLKAAVEALPDWVRERLGLGADWCLRSWERRLVHAAAAAGDRLLIPSSPAVRSCRRLGLPDDYLFRR